MYIGGGGQAERRNNTEERSDDESTRTASDCSEKVFWRKARQEHETWFLEHAIVAPSSETWKTKLHQERRGMLGRTPMATAPFPRQISGYWLRNEERQIAAERLIIALRRWRARKSALQR